MANNQKNSSKRKSDSQNSDFLKKPKAHVNEDNFESDNNQGNFKDELTPFNDISKIK